MRQHLHPHGPSVLGRAGSVIALAGLLGMAWRCVSATHARDRTARPATLPKPLQVWEGEGGQNQMPDSPPASPAEARPPGDAVPPPLGS